MSMCLELACKCEALNFVVTYTPTGCTKGRRIETYFLAEAGGLGGKDSDERVFVLMDANPLTGLRMEDGRVR